jgi:hypothetical protein
MCGGRIGARQEYSSGGTRPNWNDIMTSATGLQCKTYALSVPIVVFASTGNVLLGKGMRQIGEIPWSLSPLGGLFVKTFSNGWVWLGIGSLLLFLVSFMVVLSWADYSFVMPASAASYAVATLMSHWLLGESVTPQRWAGHRWRSGCDARDEKNR